MAENYTRFTDVEVTGELKANGVKLDLSDITRPTAAGDSYSKAQLKTVVDAVDALMTLLGKPTS